MASHTPHSTSQMMFRMTRMNAGRPLPESVLAAGQRQGDAQADDGQPAEAAGELEPPGRAGEPGPHPAGGRSGEHTSALPSLTKLVCPRVHEKTERDSPAV